MACDLGDVALLQKAQVPSSPTTTITVFTSSISVNNCSSVRQVLAAGARAQSLIGKYSADVESATPAALRRLLAWKETRGSRDAADNTAAAAAALM